MTATVAALLAGLTKEQRRVVGGVVERCVRNYGEPLKGADYWRYEDAAIRYAIEGMDTAQCDCTVDAAFAYAHELALDPNYGVEMPDDGPAPMVVVED